jgi:hypothetical protein
MTDAAAPYQAEEHWVHDSRWVKIRARGSDWSWLTIEEAAKIGRIWDERYGQNPKEVPS